MNFQNLVNEGIIEPVPINKANIQLMLKMVREDIKTAKILIGEERWDWAHNIAYNAIRESCLALVYAYGYRPKGEAKHKNTFVFVETALESKFHSDIKRADKMRQQRNVAVYQQAGTVSEDRAKRNVDFAEKFTKELETIVEALLAL